MKRKKSQKRRKEIIETARELIIHEGVQGITIKNIARKNRISEPAVYRHFKNKRAILVALIESFEDSLMEAIDQPIRHHKNPLIRLKEIMKTHMIFTEKKKGVLFAVTAESIHFNDDYLRRKILAVIERYKARIRDILYEAKKGGGLRENINLDAVSLTFFGLIQTAIIQFALTSYTVPPITKFQTLWNIFLKGIGDIKPEEKISSKILKEELNNKTVE